MESPVFRFFNSLFGRVVIALVLGIAVGYLWPDFAVSLKWLGDGFIKLIKMIIPAIVFCVVVTGMMGAGDLKKVGRVGVKAVVYFELVTTIALALGIALAFWLKPGVGMNIDPNSLDASTISTYASNAKSLKTTTDFFLGIVPNTIFDAFAKGDILQVLLVSILFGAALSLIGAPARGIADGIAKVSDVFFKMMLFIIKLAPLGVFGAIAFTTGKYGIESVQKLAGLVALFYLAAFLFVFVVLGAILRFWCGLSIFKFVRYLREELMIVLGTASSDSVLPQIMRKLEAMGIKDSTVGLVIPTGYSFNLDGFSIYLTLAAVFIAQATNTPLSMMDLLTILGIAMVTSKGAHGVPGSAIVILAATLGAFPAIPAIGLVLVLSVDWFMGIARALSNLVGNCVATVAVAKWEGDIDLAQARQRAQPAP